MKIRRANYVTMLWNRATTTHPSYRLSPCDHWWSLDEKGRLRPTWFEGPAIPNDLNKRAPERDDDSTPECNQMDSHMLNSQNSTNAWSEDSDSDEDID